MENQAIQYKIKLEVEKLESETIGFDKLIDVNLKNSFIKKINKSDIESFVNKYSYLKSIPTYNKYYFGLFFNIKGKEYLGSILVYSDECENNPSIWNKYSFNNKILSLSLGLNEWWTPKNTASYFISRCNKIIKKDNKYKVIIDKLDPKKLEIGIIYQSLNWYYLGDIKNEIKIHVVLNDSKYTFENFEKKFEVTGQEEILEKFPKAKIYTNLGKKTYITFICSKTYKKKYLSEIKDEIKDYPKKDDVIKLLNNQTFIIYKLVNVINNKIYIGQTTRMLRHRLNEYKRHRKCNSFLKSDIIEFGFENFKCEIIEECEGIEELNEREIYWIQYYNSMNRNIGYNIVEGGNNSLISEETRQKLSDSHKGIKQSVEWINKRIPLKGSEEAKKLGRPKTEEQKQHLSDISSGENGYWYGKARDIETINKIKETKSKQKDKIIDCNVQKIGVGKYDKETNELIESYLSMSQASQKLGICYKTIFNRCNGITPQKGDFILKLL